MHCPYCGHTAPYHAEDVGCTECTCDVGWRDIAIVHIGLYHYP